MNKIENYLGVANHDIQMANNSQELKSYVASILCENDELQKENKKQKEVINKAIEELKKGLHELDIRKREEVYIEQYIEEALNMLKEVE